MKKNILLAAFILISFISAKAQNILTISTIPAVPSDTQIVSAVVSTQFSSGGCNLTAVLTASSNDTLYLGLFYQTGMLAVICNSTDTIELGFLPCIAHVLSVSVIASGGTNGTTTSSIPLNISCSGVGISELNGMNDILIFPSYVAGELNIHATGKKFLPVRISILNLLGKTVYSLDELLTVNNSVKRIDVSTLPKGVYLVKAENAMGSRIKKFVKE